MKKLLVFSLCMLLSIPTLACLEAYCGYVKVSLGYVLDQPNDINLKRKAGETKVQLYTGDNANYILEAGITVPTDNNELRLGVTWSDLLNQGPSRTANRPYYFEPFVDYQFNYCKRLFTRVGVGYKMTYDNQFYVDDGTYKGYSTMTTGNNIIDRVTARLSVGYKLTDRFSLSLDHHSQWLAGKPFSNAWEYHNTAIMLNFTY